jgi:hypothetical protein
MNGKITDQELTEALNVQTELNMPFAEELLQGGHITVDQFRKFSLTEFQEGGYMKDM